MKNKRLTVIMVAIIVSICFLTSKAHAETLTTRYNGVDRYETAAKVCQDGWKTDSSYVVIVNGENFPDALSAAPLAKKFDAPILLTGGNQLNPYTSVEINRLGAKNAFIIGGRGVISQGIEDALKSRGIKITRLGGSDRYETAIQIAGKLGKANEVALINSNDFRDGMSISAIAAAKGMPVIPLERDYMPTSVKKYLQGYKKADQIYVIGGQDKISDNVVSALTNVKRIGQGDIYSSNINIIESFLSEVNTSAIYVSSAKDFPDSLGASALAPRTASPIVFVDSPMSYETQRFLKSHIVSNIKVLGGPGAVSYESEQITKKLPLGVSNTENITDTIWQNEKYTPRPTMVITASDGNKKEINVDWKLTKINTSKPGIYTFTGTIHGTDKTVFTTLIVKPIAYKIDDLVKTANSRQNFIVPTTIEAQMTDGSKAQVPVTWDYGTQSGNKPGVYIFNGTVVNYSKKVKLTLTVNSTDPTIKAIKTINNIKKTVPTKSSYTFPTTVTAIMTDNSNQSVAVTWGNETKYGTGVYTYEGTVNGYTPKVGLMLIVTGEGGKDPNDPNYPDNPVDPNNPDVTDLGELAAIMQNEAYPTTIKDKITGKQVPVTWTDAVSIDSTFVDSQYLDDCRIAKFTLNGVISGNKKVKATIGVIPKILTLNVDGNTNNVPAIVINVRRSDYPSGVFNMNDLSTRINAVINKSDGTREAKNVHVLLWNPPVIDISDSNTYYVTATISHYSTPVTVTIRVQ